MELSTPQLLLKSEVEQQEVMWAPQALTASPYLQHMGDNLPALQCVIRGISCSDIGERAL